MAELRTQACDVLVVGGGPAGLSAATALRAAGVERVVVLEREAVAGGVPRHCAHPGFGLRDRRRAMSGPAYARRLVEDALGAGTDLRTSAMLTDWDEPGPTGVPAAFVTSPVGRTRIVPRAVVLATGARERPRSARLIPGDRPDGIVTTGQLQALVHLHGRTVGTRAVVVGSAPIAWSAVLTLREAGCRTVLMVAEGSRVEVPAAAALAVRTVLRVPVAHDAEVVRIVGRHRVQAVELRHRGTGRRTTVACDTVVLTGDWTPEGELAARLGLEAARGFAGPAVDATLGTSRPGVFAVGNLVHPVDTADVAAIDGGHVAAAVGRWLSGARPSDEHVRVRAGRGLAWVSPGVLRAGSGPAPRGRLLAWPTEHVGRPRVCVTQDGAVVDERVVAWPAAPGRVFRLPWTALAGCDLADGDVTVGLDLPDGRVGT